MKKPESQVNLGTADQLLYAGIAVTLSLLGFVSICLAGNVALPVAPRSALIAVSAVFALLLALSVVRMRSTGSAAWITQFPLFALIAAAATMGVLTLAHFIPYLTIPADVLSFSESIFVSDIIKFRTGEPLYSPPADNNSHPYTPGAQLLTYGIATLLGQGENLVAYRIVQFSFVMLSALVATGACQRVTQLVVPENRQGNRWMWAAAWYPVLLMIAFDWRFNEYNHSLHNDGLALLISACGFWLIAQHAVSGDRRLLLLMAVLPALGFLVKQSQLMWAGIFVIYLVLAGGTKWRDIILLCVTICLTVFLVVAGCYYLWSEPFGFWVFQSLGGKRVSLMESISHLMDGGTYALMGGLAGYVIIAKAPYRPTIALWICWAIIFSLQAYTSGVAYRLNHMGPAVLIATTLFLAAVAYFWTAGEADKPAWISWTQRLLASVGIILLLGGLGHLREPVHAWPADMQRYVAQIEQEFEGQDPHKVLLDIGSWVYLKDGIVMKDRSSSVAIHAGVNQSEINNVALQSTIDRIERQVYDKILARQFDTKSTAYDFQGRGTGVKAAITENYHEVRRIPKVHGVTGVWWPKHIIEEVIVLEANGRQVQDTERPSDAT